MNHFYFKHTSLLLTLPTLLCISSSAPAQNSQPNAPINAPQVWKMPAAEAQKWAARLKKLCPEEGWTVTARGNDIVIERDQPVKFGQVENNESGFRTDVFRQSGKPVVMEPLDKDKPAIDSGPVIDLSTIGRDPYRLTLSFAPPISRDKYDALEAEQKASIEASYKLWKKYGTGTKHFAFGANLTQEEKKRRAAFGEEVKKLTFHHLPHFYAPD